jgi:hypothetical protein
MPLCCLLYYFLSRERQHQASNCGVFGFQQSTEFIEFSENEIHGFYIPDLGPSQDLDFNFFDFDFDFEFQTRGSI